MHSISMTVPSNLRRKSETKLLRPMPRMLPSLRGLLLQKLLLSKKTLMPPLKRLLQSLKELLIPKGRLRPSLEGLLPSLGELLQLLPPLNIKPLSPKPQKLELSTNFTAINEKNKVTPSWATKPLHPHVPSPSTRPLSPIVT